MSRIPVILLLIPITLCWLTSLSHHSSLLGDLQQTATNHEEINSSASHVIKPSVVHDVVVLTGKNFSSFVAENKYVVVLFYGPKCPFSQQMAPEFEAAASLFKGTQVAFAKVDSSTEKELRLMTAKKLGLLIYERKSPPKDFNPHVTPSVLLLAGRGRRPYYAGSTRDEIVNWVRSSIGLHNVTAKDDAQPILVTTFTKERAIMNYSPQTPMIYAAQKQLWLLDSTNCGSKKVNWFFGRNCGSKKVKSAFEEASKALGVELLFVYADISDDDIRRALAIPFELNGDTTRAPRIIAVAGNGNKYVFPGTEMTVRAIKEFGEDFLDDMLPF